MKKYEVFPKVVTVGEETALEIEGLVPDAAYRVGGLPVRARRQPWTRALRTDAQGRLRWTERFSWPGEYLLDLFEGEAERALTTVSLYAPPPDLRRRLPGLAVVGGCCGTDHRHIEEIGNAYGKAA